MTYEGKLAKLAGVSGSSLAKLYRGENVNADILVKICYDFSYIMEMKFDYGYNARYRY